MRRRANVPLHALLAALAGALILAACAGRGDVPAPPGADDCALIAVSSNGWHAGVYLPAGAFAEDSTLRQRFPQARWFAIGWGDVRAYPGPLGPVNAITAIAWPTGSLVHAAGLTRDPREAYMQDYVDVALSSEGLASLAAAIEAELARDEDGAGIEAGPGLDPRGSAFFKARSSYHLFNTCNVWLARHLRGAGLDTGWPGGHLLPATLLSRLEARAPRACPPGEASAR
ncbi:DUF2459 domain-containing protein [Alkalicaulis satelles]|uniref:DUF2459 domain-containing protein n=1 Tax=Alkalicaulis satelles TaxID=2609175 RepID=A0A5M6ZDI2_9PROT|nr:DUF2459 domain-containing protein [Alkalicaulis satelles]KAA5802375.1 DUF2459 domain-containing protein [Alkalicaulis satelles]